MARKRKGDPISGWINLDKPAGITSTQAIAKVRRILNAQKIGHAGTLDPLATGVLPIALGEATKTIPFAQDAVKKYSFQVAWGQERDTDDSEGIVIKTSDYMPKSEEIMNVIPLFIGSIMQIPPKFSAIRVQGQRAYDLAREGIDPDLQPRTVYIQSLELLDSRENEADFVAICGKGTYIRSLARDMAHALQTTGYIKSLRREKVGVFEASNSISLDFLEQMEYVSARKQALLPLQTVLDDIPALALKAPEVSQLKSGQSLSFVSRPNYERLTHVGLGGKESKIALSVFEGVPVALIEAEGALIRPIRVFNL